MLKITQGRPSPKGAALISSELSEDAVDVINTPRIQCDYRGDVPLSEDDPSPLCLHWRYYTHGLAFVPQLSHLVGIVLADITYLDEDNRFRIDFRSLEGEPIRQSTARLLHLGAARAHLSRVLHQDLAFVSLERCVETFWSAYKLYRLSWPKGFPLKGSHTATMEWWFDSTSARHCAAHWGRLQTTSPHTPALHFPNALSSDGRRSGHAGARGSKTRKRKGRAKRSPYYAPDTHPEFFSPQMGTPELLNKVSDTVVYLNQLKSAISVVDSHAEPTRALVSHGLMFFIDVSRVWSNQHTRTEVVRSGIDKIIETLVRSSTLDEVGVEHGTPEGGYIPQLGISSGTLPLLLTALVFLPSDLLDYDPIAKCKSAISFYKKASQFQSTNDLAKDVVGFIGWFLKTGLQCFNDRSLKPFLHCGSTYLEWHDRAYELEAMRHSLGLASGVSYEDYYDMVQQHVLLGEDIRANCSANRGIGLNIVLATHARLKDILMEQALLDKVRSLRSEPLFIGFQGPPKIGKSYLTGMHHRVFANVHPTLDYHASQLYVRSFTDRFASGLEGHHSVYLIDDVGTVQPGVSGETALGPLLEIMSAANQATAASNQAEIEKKGKVFPMPQFVMVTSNKPDYGANACLATPQALQRRIGYSVELKVLPQFATPSGHVDTAKVAGEFHIHTFTVKEYRLESRIPHSDPGGWYTILDDVDHVTYYAWFHDYVTKHFARRAKAAQKAAEGAESPPCPGCALPTIACACAPGVEPMKPQMLGKLSGFLLTQAQGYSVRVSDYVRRQVFNLGQEFVDYGKSIFAGLVPLVKSYALAETLSTLAATAVLLALTTHSAVPEVRVRQSKSTATPTGPPILEFADFRTHPLFKPQMAYATWLATLSADNVKSNFYTAAPPALQFTGRARAIPFVQALARISKNIVVLTMEDGRSVHALGLKDNVFVTVQHFFIAAQSESSTIRLLSPDGRVERKFRFSDVPVIPDKIHDLVFFKLASLQVKDITFFLPERCPAAGLTFTDATLVSVSDVDAVSIGGVTPGVGSRPRPMYKYDADTRMGSCGLPLIIRSQVGVPVLAGLHAYSRTESGMSESLAEGLSRSMLPTPIQWDKLMLSIPPTLNLNGNGLGLVPNLEFIPNYFMRCSAMSWSPETFSGPFVKPLGTIKYGRVDHKSRIVMNPLWPHVSHLIPDCNKVVPQLKSGPDPKTGEWHCGETKGLAEFGEFASTFTLEELQEPIERVAKKLIGCLPHQEGHPLTEHHSLNGVDGAEFLYSFNRRTGMGLPCRGPKSKVLEGSAEENTVRYSEEARASVQAVAKAYAMGQNPGVVADCCLKDEVRKPGKLPRLFAILPYQHNDLTRRALLPIFRELQHCFLDHGGAIGCRADSEQWRAIDNIHRRFKYHLDWDFKKFDKSHNIWLKVAVFTVFMKMCEHYYPEDRLIAGYPWRAVLLGAFRVSCHLPFHSIATIFMVLTGLASGETVTSWFNTIAQMLMLEAARIVHMKETGNYPADYATSFGDDGVDSTNTESFNFFFLRKFFADHNMEITPGTKDSIPRPFMPWEEISFLKRGFTMYGDDLIMAPLDPESIAKQVRFWTPSPNETMESQLRNTLLNVGQYVAAHTNGFYDDWYHTTRDAFFKVCPQTEDSAPIPTLAETREKLLATVGTPLLYNPLRRQGTMLDIAAKVDEIFADVISNANRRTNE